MKSKFNSESLRPFINLEGLTGKEEVTRKQFTSEIKVLPEEEKTVVARISTIDEDADGDIIMPNGVDLKRFMLNPVCHVNHSYLVDDVVANVTEIATDEKGVVAKMKFADTVRANDCWKLVKDSFVKANSIGFITKECLVKGTDSFSKFITEKSMKVSDKCKRIITKWELLENSIVSLPCNPTALVMALSSKSIELSEKTIKELDLPKVEIKEEVKDKIEKNMAELKDKIAKKMIEVGLGNMTEVELAKLYKEKTGKEGYFEEEIMKFIDSIKEEKPVEKKVCACPDCIDKENCTCLGEECENEECECECHTVEEMNSIINSPEVDVKPFPNEHAARQNEPTKYESFRRVNDAFGSGIHAIYGIYTEDGKRKTEVQSIRFSKEKFTVAESKKWLTEHNYKTEVEPAEESKVWNVVRNGGFVIDQKTVIEKKSGKIV